MKRILIPTDFSENSWNAIMYGMELFKKEPCTFYLLNISPIPPYSGSGSSVKVMIKDKVLEDTKISLQELLEKIESTTNNKLFKFVTLATYDFFVDGIKREVKDKKIDLIIMGTKGATGLKRATMGSNTGDVITKVQCPVLAVPENAHYKIPKEIAFPTDYETGYDLKVLNSLMNMAQLNDSTVRIVHISKKGEELSEAQIKNKNFLHDFLRGSNHSFHRLTSSKTEEAIQCFIESRDVDMVAMVAKNINFIQRILFRPLVEEISYHTDIPFLVLHE
jgi:nucleotide-binding universal stress UspA family protein